MRITCHNLFGSVFGATRELLPYRDYHHRYIHDTHRAKEIYEQALVDEQRLLLSKLFTNLVQNRYEIKPVYSKAAVFLSTWVPKLNEDYELSKSHVVKGKEAVFATSSPNWLTVSS